MKLNLTARNLAAFFLFAMLMGEAHEVSHFLVGKALCGCWPVWRDFNAWKICPCDIGYLATAAGPIFSMALAWIGMLLLRKDDAKKQSLGFFLIWANVPQARIMTALMGGGDEGVVFRNLTSGTVFHSYSQWIASVVVLCIALPPIIAAFRQTSNKYGWLINTGFMILPLVIIGAYGFVFLNGLLSNGFLSDVWIMGTPLFITLHTLTAFVLLMLFFRKDLFTIVKNQHRMIVPV